MDLHNVFCVWKVIGWLLSYKSLVYVWSYLENFSGCNKRLTLSSTPLLFWNIEFYYRLSCFFASDFILTIWDSLKSWAQFNRVVIWLNRTLSFQIQIQYSNILLYHRYVTVYIPPEVYVVLLQFQWQFHDEDLYKNVWDHDIINQCCNWYAYVRLIIK